MKRLVFASLILFFLFLISATAFSQETTLLGGDITNGGYGGVIVKGTTIMGEPALMVGGGGAWIVNHTLLLGAEGSGLATSTDAGRIAWNGQPYRLQLAEGGVRVGYVYESNALLHLTGSVLVGGGSAFYVDRTEWPEHAQPVPEYDQDAYFLLEPTVSGELNITKWMRANLGVSYRWISDVEYDVLTSDDLGGPAVVFGLKFGRF